MACKDFLHSPRRQKLSDTKLQTGENFKQQYRTEIGEIRKETQGYLLNGFYSITGKN